MSLLSRSVSFEQRKAGTDKRGCVYIKNEIPWCIGIRPELASLTTRMMYPMKLRIPVLVAGILLAFHTVQAGEIQWQPWSDSVFAGAKQEGRFVLLDLGTGWCHWCHVMEAVTYKDPAVIELIRKRYVAVRVDADSRPDLSNRYEDYGWPATIVFNGDGGEIVKRQGYIPPKPMASMLQAVIDDPTPGPSVLPEQKLSASPEAFLTADARKNLRQVLVDTYDPKNKGWGTVQKFLNWDVIEYCMVQAKQGDTKFEEMGRETLAAQLQLIDPVWGGACQYSTDGDWKHPHFEKIMQMQAENLRTYATAYALWRDPPICKRQKDFAAISRISSLRRRARFLPVKTPISYRASMRPNILG